VVYIQEAHPTDLWQMPSNVKKGILYASPRTDTARAEIATVCVKDLGVEFPALVDGIDDAIEQAYTGWPDRLYLIGTDGRIAYKSRPGPFGFLTEELEAALDTMLPAVASEGDESL